ncbi:putative pseudouridine Synthase [Halobacteriovorax marinus SJ]|uniref:Pseudouridine Synthase n=1 Tax=Halobacteriovorax marinus (strain ATCC BAA-682 / DSM 15412 / SJ) TaxID=862908 RepID=E1WXS1_HALMS|nr:RNA pseudouridine synthase [Halobacteriovorax marinus]CBW25878.1 putative pseudouridine Synthase [Halobacteriovorax marinus SJ]
MKNPYKIFKLTTIKEESLYFNAREILKRDFSLSLSQKSFDELLKQNRIRISGAPPSHELKSIKKGVNFSISISKSQLKSWSLPIENKREFKESMLIHEENLFLVANKPAMLSSTATTNSKQDNLHAILTRYISGGHKEKYLSIHHRIDFETSGLLIFCKKKSQNKFFSDLFEQRKVKKTYLALIKDPDHSFKDQKVENFLERDPKNKMKMMSTTHGGKKATTYFKEITHQEGMTLVEAKPETGRFHQIRVHLAELGFPIIGDSIYSQKSEQFPRTMLHAYKLSFPHPQSDESLEFIAPLPHDFPQNIIQLVKE